VDASAAKLLTSRERPIVLLKKHTNRLPLLAPQIAPHSNDLGIMLPYSPLHHLLFAPAANHLANQHVHAPEWLVMTSGNFADEPIVTDNAVALARLSDLADALLLHNRAIYTPCDDSVVRVHAGEPMPIRRARGYAPLPIHLPLAAPPLLAVGGELKHTFCLAQGRHAFLSQHIGDLKDFDTLENFDRILSHLQKLFHIEPQLVACDLHPNYLSTFYAGEYAEKAYAEKREREGEGLPRLIKVQHHHAHLAALMAEHALPKGAPVIGFCIDGTGYGTDGAIWGGEVMVADYLRFERVAHLHYFPLPGGDTAIRHPYRMALSALHSAGLAWDANLAPVAAVTPLEREVLHRQIELNLNCVPTSSMGRLFDVMAALAGVRQSITYEGQAAIELEALVDPGDLGPNSTESYRFARPCPERPWFDATPLLQAAVDDALHHVSPAKMATRFHNAVANLVVDMSLILRAHRGIATVALSGGVFQNMTLLRPTVRRLQSAGFEVLVHRLVPPNDGGLALGQAVVAAAQSMA
jgi:hydrogenase maturation protein HypF